jgi:hypothetical protein
VRALARPYVGERHAFADREPHSTLVDRDGKEVGELRPRSENGEPLTVDTTRVRKVG